MLPTQLFHLLFAVFSIGNYGVYADDKPWQPEIIPSAFNSFGNILQFEDSSRLMLMNLDGVYFSKTSGRDWKLLNFSDDEGNVLNVSSIQEFDYNKNVAFAFTNSGRHFYTFDQGETWSHFDVPLENVFKASAQMNYVNNDYFLLEFHSLNSKDNSNEVYVAYTKDSFKSPIKKIEVDSLQTCTFTKINPQFTEGHDNNLICIVREYNSFGFLEISKVILSTDFFEAVKVTDDPKMNNLLVLDISVEGSFAVIKTSTDRYSFSTSTRLFTSKDGSSFNEAKFSDPVRNWSYQVIDSSSNILYVAAYGKLKETRPSADIYRSDYNGEYFEKIIGDVFANMLGMTMISKVQTLDGVWVAAHNTGEFEGKDYKAESKITYNDGKDWKLMRSNDDDGCNIADGCSVHLAWLSHRAGDGKIVTGQTPGILIGVGNTGTFLSKDLKSLKTFVSRDGGLSWSKVADEPTLFSFGDLGNLLITIPVNLNYFIHGDEGIKTDYFSYSLDQGQTWTVVELDTHIIPIFFTNNEDNSDLTFVLNSFDATSQTPTIFTIDFTSAFERTCEEADMEEWVARVNPETGKEECVYGHREKFSRRKADAKCFINKVYEDLKKIEVPCECTIEDTQCEYGFALVGESCEPIVAKLSERYCKDGFPKVKLTSRLITPGNLCTGGYQITKFDYTLNCDSKNIVDPEPKISSNILDLDEQVAYYQYFDSDPISKEIKEDALVILTTAGHIFLSFDGGNTLTSVPSISNNNKFIGYQFNPYAEDQVFLLAENGEVYISTDRGHNFVRTLSPFVVIGQENIKLSFSKTDPSRFILAADTNCKSSNGCEKRALISLDRGISYIEFPENVTNCVFGDTVFEEQQDSKDSDLVICQQMFNDGSSFSKLISSNDWFKESNNVLFEKIIGFTTSNKFMIIGEVINDNSLKAFVSVDGSSFSELKFPYQYGNFEQHAYTILETGSGELFLHLTTSSDPNKEFGALLKGNFNGTLLTTVHSHVNRDSNAFVDFEDVKSLEGLQLINVVWNFPDVMAKNAEKQIYSLITHNNAGTWSMIPAPKFDYNGKRVNCKGCSLHLHSYTERIDPSRDTFSSNSAIGMLFGLGNIGTYLSPIDSEDTGLYFSKDGGIEWKEIAKGRYMWEFGDRGSILVIAQYDRPVKVVKYSTDMGATWNEYKFSEDAVSILDLATVPSDTSLKFMMIVNDETQHHKIVTLDFSSYYWRQCNLRITDTNGKISKDSDFEYFYPKHPSKKDDCVFGHKTRYLRRRDDADCFVGTAPLSTASKVEHNCPCTREDYECDYNYELTLSGTCELVKGLDSKKGDEVCYRDDTSIWYEPTGYRKLIGSTCEGGLVLDKWLGHNCPGKSVPIYLSGTSTFFLIFVPLFVFASSLVFVYEKGVRRNGGFQRLGEIRLNEEDELQLVEENLSDKVVNAVVRFGVAAFQLGGRIVRGVQRRFNRFDTYSDPRPGAIGAFFNDMTTEEAEEDLFGEFNDQEDAREIDQLLDEEIDDNLDANFADYEASNVVTGHYMNQDSNFTLEDDDDYDQSATCPRDEL